MKIIRNEIRLKILKMPGLLENLREVLLHTNTMSTYVMVARNTSGKLKKEAVKAIILEALQLPEEDVYNTEADFYNSKA
jgi:hypothetical protein